MIGRGLPNHELEIATLLIQDISTHDISEQLNLSYHTVRNHIKHIYHKIGVSMRSEIDWKGFLLSKKSKIRNFWRLNIKNDSIESFYLGWD